MQENLYLWEIKKTVWIKGSQESGAIYIVSPNLVTVLKYLEKDINDNSVDIESINKVVKVESIL